MLPAIAAQECELTHTHDDVCRLAKLPIYAGWAAQAR